MALTEVLSAVSMLGRDLCARIGSLLEVGVVLRGADRGAAAAKGAERFDNMGSDASNVSSSRMVSGSVGKFPAVARALLDSADSVVRLVLEPIYDLSVPTDGSIVLLPGFSFRCSSWAVRSVPSEALAVLEDKEETILAVLFAATSSSAGSPSSV